MNYKKTLETLIRLALPFPVAEEYLADAKRTGSAHITIVAETPEDSDHVVVVDCNRGGMENAYSVSIS